MMFIQYFGKKIFLLEGVLIKGVRYYYTAKMKKKNVYRDIVFKALKMYPYNTVESSCSWGTNVRSFVGNPCPRMNIPTNLYTIHVFCLISFKIIPITLRKRNYAPRTRTILAPHEHLPPTKNKWFQKLSEVFRVTSKW